MTVAIPLPVVYDRHGHLELHLNDHELLDRGGWLLIYVHIFVLNHYALSSFATAMELVQLFVGGQVFVVKALLSEAGAGVCAFICTVTAFCLHLHSL